MPFRGVNGQDPPRCRACGRYVRIQSTNRHLARAVCSCGKPNSYATV